MFKISFASIFWSNLKLHPWENPNEAFPNSKPTGTRTRNRKQLSWHLKEVNKNRTEKAVDPLPLQNQGNLQKSIAMSCKMLDYWDAIPKYLKTTQTRKKTEKTCQNSACRTPSVEGMRSNRQQRLTTPRSAPAIADWTDRSALFFGASAPSWKVTIIRTSPSLAVTKRRKRTWKCQKWQKCDCHDCEIPTEIGSVLTTTGSCLLIRKIPKSWPAGLYIQLRMFQHVSISQKPKVMWGCGLQVLKRAIDFDM